MQGCPRKARRVQATGSEDNSSCDQAVRRVSTHPTATAPQPGMTTFTQKQGPQPAEPGAGSQELAWRDRGCGKPGALGRGWARPIVPEVLSHLVGKSNDSTFSDSSMRLSQNQKMAFALCSVDYLAQK